MVISTEVKIIDAGVEGLSASFFDKINELLVCVVISI